MKGLFWKSSDFAFKIKKLEQNNIIKPKFFRHLGDFDESFNFRDFPFFHNFDRNLSTIWNLFDKEETNISLRLQSRKSQKVFLNNYWKEVFRSLFKNIEWQGRYVFKRRDVKDNEILKGKWGEGNNLQKLMVKTLRKKLKNTLRVRDCMKKIKKHIYIEEQCKKGTERFWKTVTEARNKIERQISLLSIINSDEGYTLSHEQKQTVRVSKLLDKISEDLHCSVNDFFNLAESFDAESFLVQKRVNRIMHECLLLEILIARVDQPKSNFWKIHHLGLSSTTLQRAKQDAYFLECLYSPSSNKSCMILNGLIMPIKKELLQCGKKFHSSQRLEYLVRNMKLSKTFRSRFQQIFNDSLSLFEKIQEETIFRQKPHFFSFFLDLKLQIRQKQLIFTLFKTFSDNLFLRGLRDTDTQSNRPLLFLLNKVLFGDTHMPRFANPLNFCQAIFHRFCQNDIIMKHFPTSIMVKKSKFMHSYTSHQTITDLILSFEKSGSFPQIRNYSDDNDSRKLFGKVFALLDNLEETQALDLSSTFAKTDTVFEDDRFLFSSFQVQLPFYFIHELGLHFILNWNLQLFASRLYRMSS